MVWYLMHLPWTSTMSGTVEVSEMCRIHLEKLHWSGHKEKN